MDYKESALDAIGNTLLIKLNRIIQEYKLQANIFAKLERSNPSGSIKDRVAKEMILDALKDKKINKETLIIEPTSGNTGIGLASVCASLGLKLYIFMPSNCSIERVKMMKGMGASVIMTDANKGMQGAIDGAKEMQKNNPGSFIPSQFDNPNNSLAHYKTTGPEIYEQLEGKIDIFVASFGTGGTLTGISRFLKEKNPSIKSYGLEPLSSPLLTKGFVGKHKIQGIGANFKPNVLDLKYVDGIYDVSDEEAYEYTRALARTEGLLCGISSGCNLCGAIKLAKEKENFGKNIVTVLPDDGERYLSVEGLYE
jgi:cysteine synthase A